MSIFTTLMSHYSDLCPFIEWWVNSMNHSPFNELNSWINSLLKKRNGNVNQFTFFGEWWIEFSIHFQFILKKKVDFWMKKKRRKLHLFIEDIAFKSNNFSKFPSVKLPLRPCNIISWDASTRLANNTLRGDATNTTNANCLLAGLTYTYSLQAATHLRKMNWKWIENELIHCQMNGELNWFTFFQNEWWIELIHCFLKWMVNWMIHQKMVNGHRSAII